MNIQARLKPLRKPVNIDGSAAGSSTRRARATELKRYRRPTSISLRSTPRMPDATPIYTGKKAPMAISTSLGASSMPSHSSSRGTQASDGIARNAWKVGSSIASVRRLRPTAAPSSSAAAAPDAYPAATRKVLATICAANPWCARSMMVPMIALGAGSMLDAIRPLRTPASAASNSDAGSSKASSAGGMRRLRRPRRAGAVATIVATAGSGIFVRSCADWFNTALIFFSSLDDVWLRESRVDQFHDGAVQIRARPDQRFIQQNRRRLLQSLQMFLRRLGIGKVAAQLHLQQRHRQADLGLIGQYSGRLARIGDGPGARLFVAADHARHFGGMLRQEFLAHVQEAVGIERHVPVQQPRAGFQLAGRHVWIESGPRIDLALFQRDAAIGVLQANILNIAALQSHGLQGAQHEQIRIGALGSGDLFALQICQRADRTVLAHHQRGPFRARKNVGRAYGIAVGLGQQRSQTGARTDVDAVGVQVFERAIAAGAEHPFDLRAVRFEFLFEPAKAAQHQTGGRIVGVVEAQFLQRRGGPGHAGKRGDGGAAGRELQEGSAFHGVLGSGDGWKGKRRDADLAAGMVRRQAWAVAEQLVAQRAVGVVGSIAAARLQLRP